MSGAGWQGAGAGKKQLVGASQRERRWEEDVNERALKMNGCGWGGGVKKRETKDP